jgi:hypothetical protein
MLIMWGCLPVAAVPQVEAPRPEPIALEAMLRVQFPPPLRLTGEATGFMEVPAADLLTKSDQGLSNVRAASRHADNPEPNVPVRRDGGVLDEGLTILDSLPQAGSQSWA